MSNHQWVTVDRGRVACEYNGHMLQVVRNPDREDTRKYISIVDKVPVGNPSYNMSGAKRKAISLATQHKAKRTWPPKIEPEPQEDLLGAAMHAVADEPAPFDARAYFDIAADLPPVVELEIVETPEPEPEQEPEPEALPEILGPEILDVGPLEQEEEERAPEPNRISIDLTGTVLASDALQALNAIQAAVQLLRELGHIECRINLSQGITL